MLYLCVYYLRINDSKPKNARGTLLILQNKYVDNHLYIECIFSWHGRTGGRTGRREGGRAGGREGGRGADGRAGGTSDRPTGRQADIET